MTIGRKFDEIHLQSSNVIPVMFIEAIFVLPCLLALIRWKVISYRRPATQALPPGPPSVPIFGNLLGIPLEYPWRFFSRLKNTYGKCDLVYYHGLGNSVLVLNGFEPMQALLSKTGNTFCSRPNLVVASELMDLVNSTALAPFGPRWKLHRKFIHVAFSPSSVRKYDQVLEDVAFRFNEALSKAPQDFVNHTRLTAGRIIMSTTYGISVDSPNDPYIVKAEQAMTMISRATVLGAFLVDLVPSLKYLPSWAPFASFHRVGSHGRSLIAKLVESPFQHVKDKIAQGTAPPSFARDVMLKPELDGERTDQDVFEHNVKWACASMYAAGQEVISSSILNMIMAMAKYPEKMKIAQAELDAVVGADRYPTIADRENLPYIHAIVKETLRWHPPLPMDIARCSLEDTQYNGYFIPKGTIVVPNIWNIAHQADEDFPPDTFAPERFLRSNPTQDPSTYCFGFGRRVCPGRYLAENSIFLITAWVLSAFDITPAMAPDGAEIPISVQYSSGLVSLPEDFQCCFKPRRVKGMNKI